MESRAASPRTLNSLKGGSVSDFTRQDAKNAKKVFLLFRSLTWRALRPFDVAQDMLCVSYTGCWWSL